MKIVLKTLVGLFLFSILLVLVLKWLPIWYTPVMLLRSFNHIGDDNFQTRKEWVSIEQISKEQIKAVVSSEDNRFFTHFGFDFEQIGVAIEDNRAGKRTRGASTISQQTAKNVFTFHEHTWFRKGIEAYFTLLIEIIWGKERIMEVYLNIVELGKGVYGVQAASQYYFKKDAVKLTRNEASLFAAALPTPLKSNPGKPSKYLIGRGTQISSLIPKLEYPEWVEKLNK